MSIVSYVGDHERTPCRFSVNNLFAGGAYLKVDETVGDLIDWVSCSFRLTCNKQADRDNSTTSRYALRRFHLARGLKTRRTCCLQFYNRACYFCNLVADMRSSPQLLCRGDVAVHHVRQPSEHLRRRLAQVISLRNRRRGCCPQQARHRQACPSCRRRQQRLHRARDARWLSLTGKSEGMGCVFVHFCASLDFLRLILNPCQMRV